MAKRFIDTDIFKKRWIRMLDARYKLLYLYLFTDCSHYGVWDVDLEVAGIRLGFSDLKKQEQKILSTFDDQIYPFKDGQKWWLKDFCDFQYGQLKETNRMHLSVIEGLEKCGLHDIYINQHKGHISPLQGVKDKDKDKVQYKNKELDKEKEKELQESFDIFWNEYHEILQTEKKEKQSAWREWKKLNLADRRLAWNAIKPYAKSLDGDKTFTKYARTYLKDKVWENEYKPGIIKANTDSYPFGVGKTG